MFVTTFVITITVLVLFLIEVIASGSFYSSFLMSLFVLLPVYAFETNYFGYAKEVDGSKWVTVVPVLGPLLILGFVISKWQETKTTPDFLVRKSSLSGAYPEIPDSGREGSTLDAYEELMGKSFENTVQQGDEFEVFCAFLLEKEGYIIEKVEGGSGDRGTDIRVRTPGVFGTKISVQCKHYIDRTVGSNVIQTSMGVLHLKEESFDQVAVMTSGTFTKAAKEMATANNVKLIDNIFLKKLSKKYLVGISLSEILQRGQIWVG